MQSLTFARSRRRVCAWGLAYLLCSPAILAKPAQIPEFQAVHTGVGQVQLRIFNNGSFGGADLEDPYVDPYTGQLLRGLGSEFPKQSHIMHFRNGGIVVSAIVRGDTLASSWTLLGLNNLAYPNKISNLLPSIHLGSVLFRG